MHLRIFQETVRRWSWCFLFLSLLVLAAADGLIYGQEFRATVTGRVTDPQGALIPGVTVTVANVKTNVSIDTVTNDSGNYTVSLLQPGEYRVTAELPGFKKFVRAGIVRVNVQFRIEEFNALNTPIYNGPDTTVNSPGFGRIIADQINFPRHIQLGLRFVF